MDEKKGKFSQTTLSTAKTLQNGACILWMSLILSWGLSYYQNRGGFRKILQKAKNDNSLSKIIIFDRVLRHLRPTTTESDLSVTDKVVPHQILPLIHM